MADKRNNVIIGGSLMPSSKDTPIDARSRINTIADIETIELPYVGMMFYVKDEHKFYVVNSLKAKNINGIEVEGMLIDKYAEIAMGKSAYDIAVENGYEGEESDWLAELVGPQGPVGPVGPQGEQGIQGEKGETGSFDPEQLFEILSTENKTIMGAINELFALIKGLHPDPLTEAKVYYGYIPQSVMGEDIKSFDQITEEMFTHEDSHMKAVEPKELNRVSLGMVPEGHVIVVAIPAVLGFKGYLDNGLVKANEVSHV